MRSEQYPLGFPNLGTNWAQQLDDSNRMAQISLRRISERMKREGFAVVEHPYRSFLWWFPQAQELLQLQGIFATVLFNHQWGGERFKGTQLLHNCPALHKKFHTPVPPPSSPSTLPYDVWVDEVGATQFDTAKEAEYPWEFCCAYAEVVHHALGELRARCIPREPIPAGDWLRDELRAASRRLGEELYNKAVANELQAVVDTMQKGGEGPHMLEMVRRTDHRGSDVQLWCGELSRDLRQRAPYPAFRWQWKPTSSYAWKHCGHINVLELVAFLSHVKKSLESSRFISKRFLHVVDSQVTAAVVAKGRSSSRQLNMQLRRVAGHALAGDIYPLVVWTISAWNFSDRASRRLEPARNTHA